MDTGEFRELLSRSGVGIWGLIETAIRVANSDYGDELRRRRDKIVESLYKPAGQLCGNCNTSVNNDVVQEDDQYYPQSIKNSDNNIKNTNNNSHDDDNNKCNNNNSNNNWNSNEDFISKSPLTPESNHRNLSGGEEEEDLDPYGGLFDDEQSRIIDIKEQLEYPNQSEEAVVDLLQSLADMDITFQALKETDIGRYVNRLRKHPSNEVRRLVKQLVRKWKETVDEWVKVNQPRPTSNLIADGDSPQQNIPRNQQNGHHQVPDFGYSPNPQNGSSSADRSYIEHETKPKPPYSAPRREAPSRPAPQSAPSRPAPQSAPRPTSASLNRAPRETAVDDERLNSARKRLQENYQEANNAKKQRTIQVMDIHDLPKQKNTFFAKNKGSSQGRHHR